MTRDVPFSDRDRRAAGAEICVRGDWSRERTARLPRLGGDARSRVLARTATDDQRHVRLRADLRRSALDQRPVDGDVVREVIRDYDLQAAAAAAPIASHLVLVKSQPPPCSAAEQ